VSLASHQGNNRVVRRGSCNVSAGGNSLCRVVTNQGEGRFDMQVGFCMSKILTPRRMALMIACLDAVNASSSSVDHENLWRVLRKGLNGAMISRSCSILGSPGQTNSVCQSRRWALESRGWRRDTWGGVRWWSPISGNLQSRWSSLHIGFSQCLAQSRLRRHESGSQLCATSDVPD